MSGGGRADRVGMRHGLAAPGRLFASYGTEATWVVLGQVATLLATLGSIKVLTAALPPSAYGLLTLVTTATILPIWLLLAPVSQAALRRYATAHEEGRLGGLVGTTFGAYLVVSGFVIAGALLVAVTGGLDWTGLSRVDVALAALLFGTDAWTSMALGLTSAARRRRAVALASAAAACGRVGLLAVVMRWTTPSVTWALACLLTVSAIAALVTTRVVLEGIRGERRLHFDGSMLRAWLSYGLPIAGISVFAWLQAYADRYLVAVVLDTAQLGAYVAALQVANSGFAAAGNLLSQFAMPIVFQMAGDGRDRARLASADSFVFRVSTGLLLCGAAVAFVFWRWGPEVLRVLTRTGYEVPGSVVGLLAWGGLATAVAEVTRLGLLARNRTSIVLGCKAAVGIAGPAVLGFLAWRSGLAGAAAGSAIVGLMLLGVTVFSVLRAQRARGSQVIGADRGTCRQYPQMPTGSVPTS